MTQLIIYFTIVVVFHNYCLFNLFLLKRDFNVKMEKYLILVIGIDLYEIVNIGEL